jgi:DNA-directed RNA polymerase specialized sigma subunit
LSEEQIRELIIKIKSGDEKAWGLVYENFRNYVHERAWQKLRGMNLKENVKCEMEQDLFQAGWKGFISALKRFDPDKGKFLTYATSFIDEEISDELDFYINSLGINLNEKGRRVKAAIKRVYIEDDKGNTIPTAMARSLYGKPGVYVDEASEIKEYSAERRGLQYLSILKLMTDENHQLSKEDFSDLLRLYRVAKYGTKYDSKSGIESDNTITKTIEEIITELDPLEYSEDNEDEYRIKYDGYKEDRIKKKLNKEKGTKADSITNFWFSHIFTNDELDRLIQLVCFSDMLDANEKSVLVKKLVSTASVYYNTPFCDKEIKFNPKAVHGRFSTRRPQEKSHFVHNLKTIQYAVNNLVQISFKFNQYTEDHKMIPKSDYTHILSPYHLVVYHDNYYCIGLKKGDKRIWHYRIDLMSDVEILKDDTGREIPIEISAYDCTPICNAYWDPEKYMAEHLNMAYDEPRDICIKIRNDDYTILHDWFGDHYEKIRDAGEDDKGNKYDLVNVKTSPFMIVHWAMQYGTNVEIMDEEIREIIRNEAERMVILYAK